MLETFLDHGTLLYGKATRTLIQITCTYFGKHFIGIFNANAYLFLLTNKLFLYTYFFYICGRCQYILNFLYFINKRYIYLLNEMNFLLKFSIIE